MQFSKWVTLGFGALCLVAVAGVLNAQHLYYMAAILLTLPGVSYGLGWLALRGLQFSRELPPTAWEGEEGDIVYVAQNQTRVSRFFLTIHEPFPNWIVSADTEPPLFNVAAYDTARVTHRVRYLKRGVYTVSGFDVTAMDPLGVFAFTRRNPCDGEIVVYPLPQEMRPLPLSGSERYGFQEFTALALRGSSTDPDGVRQYAPGDPLRRIHWRQTARTGKLNVIEFEETQTVNLAIVLDAQQGTEYGKDTETTLEYAVRLAASIAHQATQKGIGIRLVTAPSLMEEANSSAGAALRAASVSGRGQDHLFLIFDALARVEAKGSESIGAVVREAVGAIQPGTTLVILTSRCDRTLPASLTRYAAHGANILIAYIDPATFEGGPARPRPSEIQDFQTELLALDVHLFHVRRNDQNVIDPENISHVEMVTGEPALARA